MANSEVNNNFDNKQILACLEFLESSDEGSDENEQIICIAEYMRTAKKPKIFNYIDYVVHNYSEIEFKKNFRATKETTEKLILEFEASQFYPNSGRGVEAVSAENQMLSFLWFAGNKSSLRDVASRFGIGESTIHRNCDRVMDFLVHIAPTVIKLPKTEEEKVKAAEEFIEISGFPGVLGCIDGTYIPIRTPAKKIKSTYVNRHDLTSITLQGICSAKKEFVDVFVGPPSKVHDSRVFQLSFVSSELPALCESEWHLLGDAAYPLREWLLTPYRDYGNLTDSEKVFNRTHSGCRVTIENTFGILKQRFRQLMRLDFWTVDRTTKFVLSCCVLHNLCIRGNDLWDESAKEIVEHDNVILEDVRGEAQLKRAGEVKRNRIKDSLQNHRD